MTPIKEQDLAESIAAALQVVSYDHPVDDIGHLARAYQREESPAARDAIAQTQGLGDLTTVLDVKIATAPTHAASKPVALTPSCAATRHAHFVLDGTGPAYPEAPAPSEWPDVHWMPGYDRSTSVNLDALGAEQVARWAPGQRLLLDGSLLTGRDAAHKRICDLLARGESLPVDFTNRAIYYVGPIDPVRDEVVGPAGPTARRSKGAARHFEAIAARSRRRDAPSPTGCRSFTSWRTRIRARPVSGAFLKTRYATTAHVVNGLQRRYLAAFKKTEAPSPRWGRVQSLRLLPAITKDFSASHRTRLIRRLKL